MYIYNTDLSLGITNIYQDKYIAIDTNTKKLWLKCTVPIWEVKLSHIDIFVVLVHKVYTSTVLTFNSRKFSFYNCLTPDTFFISSYQEIYRDTDGYLKQNLHPINWFLLIPLCIFFFFFYMGVDNTIYMTHEVQLVRCIAFTRTRLPTQVKSVTHTSHGENPE